MESGKRRVCKNTRGDKTHGDVIEIPEEIDCVGA